MNLYTSTVFTNLLFLATFLANESIATLSGTKARGGRVKDLPSLLMKSSIDPKVKKISITIYKIR